MPTLFICNAFSLSMLDRDTMRTSSRSPVPISDPARAISDWLNANREGQVISAVGHANTAAIFESLLNRPVPMNRATVCVKDNEALLIGQYVGPRLPEGATELPEGARIEWWFF